MGDLVFRVIENGLDEGLEGGIARLEVVNVFFVDAFAPMIGVGIVDAFGTVDGGTGSTAWCVSITLVIDIVG